MQTPEPETPASVASPAVPKAKATGGNTYGQIVKSSIVIGGSSVLEVAIGIVRTKATALLLGPAGFGLMGLYTSILNLAQSTAGMGINSSGVRQIAAAVGTGDRQRVGFTASVLRRASVALGLFGGLLLVILARPISKLTFDSYEYVVPVALLSLALLFRVVSDGQRALVQGLRRIPELAKITVYGGLVGTVVGIALVYVFRERGVVPTLIAINGATLLFSWWFCRRERLEDPPVSLSEVGEEASALLKLGFAFMASGMLTMGAAYAIRIMIVREIGFEAAGFYQSAWTIGGLYVGFILRAMGADFYPRLSTVVADRAECNRLVNEQAEVSLLLAGPGIIGTLALAPLVIPLLYSSAFGPAVEVLRWICLGATLQVITWPIGFIIVAEGRQGLFFWSEFAYTLLYMVMAWAFVRFQGLNGAGMAFFASYILHWLIVYPIVRRLTGFAWSRTNTRIGLGFLLVIGIVFGSHYVLPFWLATTVGAVALVLNAVYSARILVRLVSTDRVPRQVRRLRVLARIAPPEGRA
jgi:PST family polysaccharide transporter